MSKPCCSLGVILAITVIASPRSAECASETDWWRTNGAAVVEHRNRLGEAACSLFFYNKTDAAVVTWGKSDAKEISFYDSDWRFQANQPVSVAVRLGDTWLGGPADQGPPHLIAYADQERVSVPINQPMENMLRNATRISVQLADHVTSIDIERPKMPALLAAVERCRSILK